MRSKKNKIKERGLLMRVDHAIEQLNAWAKDYSENERIEYLVGVEQRDSAAVLCLDPECKVGATIGFLLQNLKKFESDRRVYVNSVTRANELFFICGWDVNSMRGRTNRLWLETRCQADLRDEVETRAGDAKHFAELKKIGFDLADIEVCAPEHLAFAKQCWVEPSLCNRVLGYTHVRFM